MNSTSKAVLSRLACFVLVVLLGACSGGGSDSPPAAPKLSGIAAAGAPIAGVVNVKGAHGATASSTIDTNGAFSLDVSSLTAPYILYAEGTVYGRSVKLYAAAVTAGSINITPITDFILRYALAGTDPLTAYAAWDGTQTSGTALTGAEALVQGQLDPLLTAAGVSSTANLLSDPFTTNRTGMDLVLDSTSFAYAGSDATITNLVTGSTYTDSLATPSGSAGLPPSDQAATASALSDQQGIDAVWQAIEDLYATTTPTAGQIDAVMAPLIADDFLDNGHDKTQNLDDMKTGKNAPAVGMTFSTSLIKAISPPASYVKAYEIRLFYSLGYLSDSEVTEMVSDGASWFWYGNRRWLDYRVVPLAIMSIHSSGTASYLTGLDVYMEDSINSSPSCTEGLYAYCHGVRSAVISGPGLPADGLILTHTYPSRELKIFDTLETSYTLTDDAAIGNIPDNSEYTISLYAEPASSLTPTAIPLEAGTVTVARRPCLNAELGASLFPSLSTPGSHLLANAVIPGMQDVVWTAPAGISVNQVYWNWSSGGIFFYASTDVAPGETSATLDTTGFPAPDSEAYLYLSARDAYGRDYRLEWQFQ